MLTMQMSESAADLRSAWCQLSQVRPPALKRPHPAPPAIFQPPATLPLCSVATASYRSAHQPMADAAAALEARLASLETNGFKLNPATANPGEGMVLDTADNRIACARWSRSSRRAPAWCALAS